MCNEVYFKLCTFRTYYQAYNSFGKAKCPFYFRKWQYLLMGCVIKMITGRNCYNWKVHLPSDSSCTQIHSSWKQQNRVSYPKRIIFMFIVSGWWMVCRFQNTDDVAFWVQKFYTAFSQLVAMLLFQTAFLSLLAVRSSQTRSCPWTGIPFSTRAYTQVSSHKVHIAL